MLFKILAIPGTIHRIAFAQTPERGSWSSAFPAPPGDILNLRDLEQGLEQMKRVPSQDVDFKLISGDKPGQSDVIILMKQKVVADIGGNLNIASLQDTDNYTAKNQSSSAGISTGPTGGLTGPASKGPTQLMPALQNKQGYLLVLGQLVSIRRY